MLDVFYYHKFHYVYIWGWLLLLPSIYNYIVFTYKQFSEYNIDDFNIDILAFFNDGKVMSTEDIIDNCNKHAELRMDFLRGKLNQDIPWFHDYIHLNAKHRKICEDANRDLQNDIDFYYRQFISFYICRRDVAIFELFKYYYGIIFNIIRFLLYSIIWFYVLMYGLGYI
jgi:hypothetical protein